MLHGLAMEQTVVVKGLDPVANAFAGTVHSDVVNMARLDKVLFFIYKAVGATGTATITVNACDDVVPTNRTAIAFKYRRCCNTTDAQGTITQATTAGFNTTAGSSEIYVIEVNKEDLAASGYGYVELTSVEVVASAVLGGIMILGVSPLHAGATANTVIT